MTKLNTRRKAKARRPGAPCVIATNTVTLTTPNNAHGVNVPSNPIPGTCFLVGKRLRHDPHSAHAKAEHASIAIQLKIEDRFRFVDIKGYARR